MRLLKTKSGFAAMEIIIIVAVIGIVGGLGFAMYSGYQHKMAKTSEQTSVAAAPTITSVSDLESAEDFIAEMDIESGSEDDLATLEKELAAF